MDIDKKEEGLSDGPVSHMDGPKKGPDDTQQHEDGANSHHGAVQLRIQQDSEPEVSDAEPDKVSGCFSPLFFPSWNVNSDQWVHGIILPVLVTFCYSYAYTGSTAFTCRYLFIKIIWHWLLFQEIR